MSQSGTTFLCAVSVSLEICRTIELCYHNRKIQKVQYKHVSIFGIDISLYDNFIDEIKVTLNEDKMHQEMF